MTGYERDLFDRATLALERLADSTSVELRDRFAMAAVSAIITDGTRGSWREDAEVAYELADAMLAARKETP